MRKNKHLKLGILVLTITAVATGAYFTLFDGKKLKTKAAGSINSAALYLTMNSSYIPTYLPTLAADEEIEFLTNQAEKPRYIVMTNKKVYINTNLAGDPAPTWNSYSYPGSSTRFVGEGCRGASCLFLGNDGEIYYTNSTHSAPTDHGINLNVTGVPIGSVKDFYTYVNQNNDYINHNDPRGIVTYQVGNNLKFVKFIPGTTPQWVLNSFPDFDLTNPLISGAKIVSIDGAVDNDMSEEANSVGRSDYTVNPGPPIDHEHIYLFFDNNKVFSANARGTSWTDISSKFPEFSTGKLIPRGTAVFDYKHGSEFATPIPAGSPLRHTIVQSADGTVHFFRYDNLGTQGDVGQKKTCQAYSATPSFSNGNIDFFFSYSDSCDINNPTFCGNGVIESGETCDDGNNADGDGCSATCQTETSTTGGTITYSETYDYGSNGVLVYLTAQGPSASVGDASTSTTAAAVDTNAITYTFKISNPSSMDKSIKLKFTLPPKFTFWSMVSGAGNPDGKTGKYTNSTNGYETLYWSNYTAKPGEHDVIFKVAPPVVAP